MTPLKVSQPELLAMIARGAVVESLRAALEKKWKAEDEEYDG